MDKSVAGAIGAVGVLMAAASAQAATFRPVSVEAAMQADSYADLLKPIPNALALLQAASAAPADTASAPAADGEATAETVQYYVYHHHHHHHHHRYYRRRYHHHHHHHHHHGF